ncbi:MAG: phosphatase PAP2 family protein [Candidatus Aminicenantes bacterium]|nr:phosphatase PAP2 family protein [Candidatus Aminicenantes bacterium]
MISHTKHKSSCLHLIICFILFFSLCGENSLYGQDRTKEHRFNKEYIQNLFDDSLNIYSSPYQWDSADYLRLSAVVGTGLVLFIFDEDIYDWSQKNKTVFSEEASNYVTDFGHGIFLAGLSTVLYTAGELSDNDRLRKTGLHSLQSWLTTGFLVLTFKFCTGRFRPEEGEGAYSFRPLQFSNKNHSFPSGHAASAFAVAAVVSEYSDSFVLDAFCYGLAAGVALSRVHLQEHWMSDVFIGSVIGHFIGKKVCGLNSQKHQNKFQLGLDCSAHHAGLTLSFSF